MTDYKHVAQELADAYQEAGAENETAKRLDAFTDAVDLCERMARGELVSRGEFDEAQNGCNDHAAECFRLERANEALGAELDIQRNLTAENERLKHRIAELEKSRG